MKILNYVNFLHYLNSNRKAIFQEFEKSKEVLRLMQSEKINTFFQPILSLENGKTIAFEVLNRPENSALFPTADIFYQILPKEYPYFNFVKGEAQK